MTPTTSKYGLLREMTESRCPDNYHQVRYRQQKNAYDFAQRARETPRQLLTMKVLEEGLK